MLRLFSIQNLVLLGGSVLILQFVILADASNYLKQYSGGMGFLDNRLWYSPMMALDMLEACGARGRQLYFIVEVSADLFYVLLRSLFMLACLLWLVPRQQWRRFHVILPLVIGGLDAFENIGIIALIWQYPHCSYVLAVLTGLFTALKWVSCGVFIVMICVYGYFAIRGGLARWLIRKY